MCSTALPAKQHLQRFCFGEHKTFLFLQNWIFLSAQASGIPYPLPRSASRSTNLIPTWASVLLQASDLPAMPSYCSKAKKLFHAQMGRTDEQNLLHPAVQTPGNKISRHISVHRRRALTALKISRVSPDWEEVWR